MFSTRSVLLNFLRVLILGVLVNLGFTALLLINSDVLAGIASLEVLLQMVVVMVLLVAFGYIDFILRRLISKEQFPKTKAVLGQSLISHATFVLVMLPFTLIFNLDRPEQLWQLFVIYLILGFVVNRTWALSWQEYVYKPVEITSLFFTTILLSFIILAFPSLFTNLITAYLYGAVVTAMFLLEFLVTTALTTVYHGLAQYYGATFWSWSGMSLPQKPVETETATPMEEAAAESTEDVEQSEVTD